MLGENQFITGQLDFNVAELRDEVGQQSTTLNVEQRYAYERVIQSCTIANSAKIFFIDGPKGTYKIYLENLILKSLRSHNHIALDVALSGIASMLLD